MKSLFSKRCTPIIPLVLASTILSGASISSAQPEAIPSTPYHYHHLRIVAGGFITGILFHPQVKGLAFVRTDIGGAYRWNENSQRWISLSEGISAKDDNILGIESMAIDPQDPERLYLAAGTYTQPGAPNGAILRSKDRGNHFERIDLPFQLGGNEPGRFAGERLVVDPQDSNVLYFGTRDHGLWRSTDAGSTWSNVKSFPAIGTAGIGIVFLAFSPKGLHEQRAIYAGVSQIENNLYVSHDSGTSWQLVAGAPTGLRPYHASFQSDGTLYITYGNAPGPNDVTAGAVWKLAAEGRWSNISPLPQPDKQPGWGYAALAVDTQHSKTLMVSTLDRWNPGDTLFRSVDGGKHWVDLGKQAQRDAKESPWLRTETGQLYFGHWIGAAAIDPFSPDHALYGTGETLWSTRDLQQSSRERSTHWSVGALGIEETAVISLLSPQTGAPLFAGLGDIGCFRADTTDANQEANALGAPRLSNCDSIATSQQSPSLMAMVGRTWNTAHHGGFSTDGGLHWQPFEHEPKGASDGGQVAIASDSSSILWSTTQGIFVSYDHGKQWMLVKCGSKLNVAASYGQDATYYVAAQEQHAFQELTFSKATDNPQLYDTADCAFVEHQAKLSTLPVELPGDSHMLSSPLDSDSLWFYGAQGINRFEKSTGSLQTVPHVKRAYALAIGKEAPHSSIPTLFVSGEVEGETGLFRSLDRGKSWTRIDDEQHQYGVISPLAADPKVFGRVYLGSNGLGVIVGESTQ